jgi:hypothetical protein
MKKTKRDKKMKEIPKDFKFPCPVCGGDGEKCKCSFADWYNEKSD